MSATSTSVPPAIVSSPGLPMIVSRSEPPLSVGCSCVAHEAGGVDRVLADAGVDGELRAALGVDEVDGRGEPADRVSSSRW